MISLYSAATCQDICDLCDTLPPHMRAFWNQESCPEPNGKLLEIDNEKNKVNLQSIFSWRVLEKAFSSQQHREFTSMS